MTVSSSPRGEHSGRPGTGWEAELRSTTERVIPDDEPTPRPNRKTRRAAARRRKP